MRTREKLIVLLVSATLILGGLIFFALRDNDLEANYFRWLLSANLKQALSSPATLMDELPSGTLLYGGLTVFAVVMTLVFLKMTRDTEVQALRKRLAEIRAEKNETDSLLQEVVRSEERRVGKEGRSRWSQYH